LIRTLLEISTCTEQLTDGLFNMQGVHSIVSGIWSNSMLFDLYAKHSSVHVCLFSCRYYKYQTWNSYNFQHWRRLVVYTFVFAKLEIIEKQPKTSVLACQTEEYKRTMATSRNVEPLLW